MKNSLQLFLLLLIIALAFVLRTRNLDQNPAGFFCDEASIGYNAFSLLKGGRDEHGRKWPIFYQAFGEYKNPIMLYSTIPFVAIFGLNEFSVRLVSATYGILGIIAVYFLGKKMFSPSVGLFSSLFLAISPWHIHFSRVALEGLIPFVLFTTLGTFSWYRHSRNNLNFYLAIVFFALALYSYFPARIFIPLYTFSLVSLERKELFFNRKKLVIGSILVFIVILPMLIHVFFGQGMARWYQVSSGLSVQSVVNVYLAHFSPNFLFLKGDIGFPSQPITRHSVHGLGELYLFQLPFIIAGLISLFKSKKSHASTILLSWLIFYPLGSSLTDVSSPQATRSIIGVVPFQIISAVGLIFLLNLLRNTKKIFSFSFISAVILAIIFSFFYYVKALKIYLVYSSGFWGWQYGPREIVKYFLLEKDNYDDLYMSEEFNAAEIFLKFYDPLNTCQEKCKMDDFYLNPEVYDASRRQIFSLSPRYLERSNFKDRFEIKKTVYYPNGKVAFVIGEVKSQ